jgi:YVTN family beta-propeller protein
MPILVGLLGLAVAAAAPRAASMPTQSGGQGPTLLVLNKEDATLAFVDPSTGKVTGLVKTGEGPHEVVVAPNEWLLAFVSNYGSNNTPGSTISMIDVLLRKELRRIDVSPIRRPHGLAFVDGKLWFTAELNRLIARYDPVADKVDYLLGTGQTTTHMVIVNKDTTRIVTANIGGNSIAVFERAANPNANWNETVVPVGRGPEGIDVSPDGKEIWAAHSQDGGVSVIDVATKKVVATLDLKTKRSNRLKFTPDGRIVLISDLDGNQIVVVDAATRAEIKRIPTGQRPLGILMVPDGSRAYVAINTDNYVSVVDLKSLTITGQISAGKGPDGMAWVAGR